MPRRLLPLLVAVLLTLPATACAPFDGLKGSDGTGYVAGNGAVRQIPVAQRGEPVALSGRDLEGRTLSLASMRGKPTVVNVWGSWCADCHAEQPHLVAAAKQLGDRAHFVGIDSRDNGTAQALAYTERYGITWPSFFSPGGEALLAFSGSVGPNAIPSTVVLDAQGRVAATIIGAIPSTLTLVQVVQDVAHG